MKTDDFIRTLSQDHGWRAPKVSAGLWLGLVLAVPVSFALFMIELGPRPDFMVAMRSPFFDLKFVVMLAMAASAFAVVLAMARPAAASRRPLLLVPVAILVAGIAADLMTQASPWQQRMIGSNSLLCLVSIPLLSLPFLAAALIALRHGAATRPGWTGAAAGLLAGGLGATLYAAHCVDDSPLFVALWYSLALFGVSALGALIGRRMLRF